MQDYHVNYRYLNKKRKLKKISIEQIAALWKVSKAVTYGSLRGEIKIDIERAKILLDLLEINFDDLFKECPIDEFQCKKKSVCDCILRETKI